MVNEKIIGEKLAAPVYGSTGVLAVNSGTMITQNIINNLRKMGIYTIYIQNGNTDIALEEIIPSDVRIKLIKLLKQEFQDIQKGETIKYDIIKTVVNEIIDNINMSENAFLQNNIGQTDDLLKLINHSIDVALLSLIVGINKQYTPNKLFILGINALLHDIGKLFDNKEEHVKKGYRIIKNNPMFTATMFIGVVQHHEHVNGTGYPQKIKGDKIHEYAKIISICDEYINCLSRENPMLPYQAIEKITAETLIKFDMEILRDFTKSIYCYPNSLTVKLNNGNIATIIAQNKNFPSRPIVMVKNNKEKNKFINLLQNQVLFIDEAII